MPERTAKADAEGNCRRHWLLCVLLEDCFVVRGKWYLGPKQSLRTLSETIEQHFCIFEAAFKPAASLALLRQAIGTTFEGV